MPKSIPRRHEEPRQPCGDADSEKLRIEGNELHAAGKFSEAEAKYGEAMRLSPKEAKLYTNRAASRLELKRYTKALQDAERAISLDPSWWRGHERSAKALLELDRFHECIDAADRGLKHTSKPEQAQILSTHKIMAQSKAIQQKNNTENDAYFKGKIKGMKSGEYCKPAFEQLMRQCGGVQAPSKDGLKTLNAFMKSVRSVTNRAIALELGNKLKEALPLYEKAAEGGDTVAMDALARMHWTGDMPDPTKGVEWAKRCAEHGPCCVNVVLGAPDTALSASEGILGEAYLHGIGVESDLQQAERWFRRGAERGYHVTRHNFAAFLAEAGRIGEALPWFERAVESEYPLAMVNLGSILVKPGAHRDVTRARQLFEKAAELGEPRAYTALAKLHAASAAGVAVDTGATRADDLDSAIQNMESALRCEKRCGQKSAASRCRLAEMLFEKQHALDEDMTVEEIRSSLVAFGIECVQPEPALEMHTQKRTLLRKLRCKRAPTELEQRAIDQLRQAASSSVEACQRLVAFYREKSDRQGVLDALKDLGHFHHDAEALHSVAVALARTGVEAEVRNAFKLLRRAQDAGHETAGENLEQLRMCWESRGDCSTVFKHDPLELDPACLRQQFDDILEKGRDGAVDEPVVSHMRQMFEQALDPPPPSQPEMLDTSGFRWMDIPRLERYVTDHPESFTGVSLLYALKGFMRCLFFLTQERDMASAMEWLVYAYLLDEKAVQWPAESDARTGELSMPLKDELHAYAESRLADSPLNGFAMLALYATTDTNQDVSFKQRTRLLAKALSLSASAGATPALRRLRPALLHLHGAMLAFQRQWQAAIADFTEARDLLLNDSSTSMWPEVAVEDITVAGEDAQWRPAMVAAMERCIGSALNQTDADEDAAATHLRRFAETVAVDTHKLAQTWYEVAYLELESHSLAESRRCIERAERAEQSELFLLPSSRESNKCWRQVKTTLELVELASAKKDKSATVVNRSAGTEAKSKMTGTIGCWQCGETHTQLSYCQGCKVAQYCSHQCQKAHWKAHKASCRASRKA